jgi:hypothetical protein
VLASTLVTLVHGAVLALNMALDVVFVVALTALGPAGAFSSSAPCRSLSRPSPPHSHA